MPDLREHPTLLFERPPSKSDHFEIIRLDLEKERNDIDRINQRVDLMMKMDCSMKLDLL